MSTSSPHLPSSPSTCLTVANGKASKIEYYGQRDYRVIGYEGNNSHCPQFGAGSDILCTTDCTPEVAAFRASLPPDLVSEIAVYPSEVQWWVLRLLAAQTEADVRVRRSRAFMALAAVHTSRSPDTDFGTIVEWVARPCRALLADMGLPPRPAVLRILAKVDCDADVDEIIGLASALRRSKRIIRLLSHERIISREVAALFAARIPLNYITPGILAAAREGAQVSRPFPYLWAILQEILGITTELGIASCPWSHLATEKAIGRLLSTLDEKVRLARHGAARFTAPLPTPAGICGLSTAISLHREGSEQRNCLFTHLDDVLAGYEFALRVEISDFRGTLLIAAVTPAWDEREMWVRHTLVGFANSAPPDDAVEYVDSWLIDAQSLSASDYHAVRLFAFNGEAQP
jgi:hypothetical protein